MAEILSLAAGSLLGGFGRYFLGGGVQRLAGESFPYGTLLVNLTGCFFIGLLHSLASSKLPLSANARMLLIVGFCGAFTTFSTIILETSTTMDQGRHLQALSYLSASVLLGFACFRVGTGLGRTWQPTMTREKMETVVLTPQDLLKDYEAPDLRVSVGSGTDS